MEEVIISSSSLETSDIAKVWDPTTGTCLMTYKGGGGSGNQEVIIPKGLSVLGSDYLIAAEKSKPRLLLWPINSQRQIFSPRLLCPGKVRVVACSPDKCYIAVSVEEKLLVYQVASGRLVGSGVRHFQAITVVRWCCDGSMLACGGEDGLVSVWLLSGLMEEVVAGKPEPRFVFNDHSLPVTDLLFTSGGFSCMHSRLISVSSDQTCKIYEMCSGKRLLSIVFPEMLTAVTITPTEMEIFVGNNVGNIIKFSLRDPRNVGAPEVHKNVGSVGDNEDSDADVYSGHKQKITCLSTSLEGDRFMSGSGDGTIRIWHVSSRQCLRVFSVKGVVTNAFFIRMPKQMFEQDVKRSLELCPFQTTTNMDVGGSGKETFLNIVTNNDLSVNSIFEFVNDSFTFMGDKRASETRTLNSEEMSLVDENKKLRLINEQLFKVSVQQLLEKRVNNDSNEDKSKGVLEKLESTNKAADVNNVTEVKDTKSTATRSNDFFDIFNKYKERNNHNKKRYNKKRKLNSK